jgi:quinol monooxygenase YgiN
VESSKWVQGFSQQLAAGFGGGLIRAANRSGVACGSILFAPEVREIMSIRLTVQLRVQPGKAAQFEAACAPAIARVKAEDKGCEMYDLFRSVEDDTRFAMIESWASEEDLAAHMTSAAMGEFGKSVGGFVAGAPVLHKYTD